MKRGDSLRPFTKENGKITLEVGSKHPGDMSKVE